MAKYKHTFGLCFDFESDLEGGTEETDDVLIKAALSYLRDVLNQKVDPNHMELDWLNTEELKVASESVAT